MLLINQTLWRMSKGIRGWILFIAALKMLVLVGTARFATTISVFLGDLYSPQMSAEMFIQAVLSAASAALIMLFGEILIGEAEYRCTAVARISLREQIFVKVLQLDVGNAEKIGATSAVASAVDGVEQMQVYYSKYLPGLLYGFVTPFYLFFRLKEASLPVATFLLFVTLAILPANNIFRQVIQRLKTDYWASFRDLTGYYLESLQSLTTLKLFNQDERRTQVLRQKADHFNGIIMDVMKVNFVAFLFTDGIIYTAMFSALGFTCWQLSQGNVTFSSAMMVLLLGYSFFASTRQLMNSTHQALTGIAAAQNIADLLDIDTSRPSLPLAPSQDTAFRGITMRGVSYAYVGREPVIKSISLDIAKDKVTALVGQSGCGKSTLAGLLLRFFDPIEGEICIDGVDYSCYTPERLRQQVIMVPQYVSIYSGTIADNLRVASPQATETEMLEVLDRVRLKMWVQKQPLGLLTDVGDAGAKLSGGQRQKIGIARVLLSDAPYIVFDEATSSVDVESEKEIWACIAELAETRTLVIISHRLSTIQNADCIYVLKEGTVVDRGTHEELASHDGLYRELVEEQQELEQHGARRLPEWTAQNVAASAG